MYKVEDLIEMFGVESGENDEHWKLQHIKKRGRSLAFQVIFNLKGRQILDN